MTLSLIGVCVALLCTVPRIASQEAREPLWSRDIGQAVTRLDISPDGRTILIGDATIEGTDLTHINTADATTRRTVPHPIDAYGFSEDSYIISNHGAVFTANDPVTGLDVWSVNWADVFNISVGNTTGDAPATHVNLLWGSRSVFVTAMLSGQWYSFLLHNQDPVWAVPGEYHGLTASGGNVVTFKNGQCTGFDYTTGALVWHRVSCCRHSGQGTCKDGVWGNNILFSVSDIALKAIDLTNGMLAWSFPFENPIVFISPNEAFVVVQNYENVGVLDGSRDLNLRWDLGLDRSHVLGVTNDYVLILEQGAVSAYALDDGTIAWVTSATSYEPAPIYNGPFGTAHLLVVDDVAAELVDIDTLTGDVRWVWPYTYSPVTVAFWPDGDTVFVTTPNGQAHALSSTGSSKSWKTASIDSITTIAYEKEHRVVIAQASGGFFRAFDVATGQQLWVNVSTGSWQLRKGTDMFYIVSGNSLSARRVTTGEVLYTHQTGKVAVSQDGEVLYAVSCSIQSGAVGSCTASIRNAATGDLLDSVWRQYEFLSGTNIQALPTNSSGHRLGAVFYHGTNTPSSQGGGFFLEAFDNAAQHRWNYTFTGVPVTLLDVQILQYNDLQVRPSLLVSYQTNYTTEHLMRFDAETGEILWAVGSADAYIGLRFRDSVLDARERVAYVRAYGTVSFMRAIDVATGSILWDFGTQVVGCVLSVDEAVLYCREYHQTAVYQDLVVAVNTTTGTEIWRKAYYVTASPGSRPLLDKYGETLFLKTRNWLRAVDVASGELVFEVAIDCSGDPIFDHNFITDDGDGIVVACSSSLYWQSLTHQKFGPVPAPLVSRLVLGETRVENLWVRRPGFGGAVTSYRFQIACADAALEGTVPLIWEWLHPVREHLGLPFTKTGVPFSIDLDDTAFFHPGHLCSFRAIATRSDGVSSLPSPPSRSVVVCGTRPLLSISNMRASILGNEFVRVEWVAGATGDGTDGRFPLNGYMLQAAAGSQTDTRQPAYQWTDVISDSQSSSPLIDFNLVQHPNLTRGEFHVFRVLAINRCNLIGDPSGASPALVLGSPPDLATQLFAQSLPSGDLTVTWEPPVPLPYAAEVENVFWYTLTAHYRPFQNANTSVPVQTWLNLVNSTLGFTISTLAPGQDYTFTVTAHNAVGRGETTNQSARVHVLCPAGSIDTAADSCVACAPGRYTDALGMTACLGCAPGSYAPRPDSACVPCDAGRYSAVADSVECKRCDPGTTAATTGSVTCETCSAGTFSVDPAVACVICAEGRFATNGSAVCEECVPGYSPDHNRSTCLGCAAGKYRSEGVTCVACPPGLFSPVASVRCSVCEDGQTYGNGSGCAGCPDNARAVAGLVCECKPGFYLDGPEASFYKDGCPICPSGSRCGEQGVTRSTIAAQVGFWRVEGMSYNDTGPVQFMRCIRRSHCPADPNSLIFRAGAAMDTRARGRGCSPNRRGPLCALCVEGYRAAGPDACVLCPIREQASSQAAWAIVGTLVLVFIIFFLLLQGASGMTSILRCKKQRPIRRRDHSGSKASLGSMQNRSLSTLQTNESARPTPVGIVRSPSESFLTLRCPRQLNARGSPSNRSHVCDETCLSTPKWRNQLLRSQGAEVRIAVGLMQIIGGLGIASSAVLPSLFQEVISIFGIFSLDILPWDLISCAVSLSTYDRLLLKALLPAALALFISIAVVLPVLLAHFCMHRFDDKKRRNPLAEKSLRLLFMFLFLIFPYMSDSCLSIFRCRQVAQTSYLVQDMSIVCGSAEWQQLVPVAVAMIIIYPCGIMTTFLLLLWRAHVATEKSELRSGMSFSAASSRSLRAQVDEALLIRALNFLTTSYAKSAWWWELLEMLNKIMLTGLIKFATDSSLQSRLGIAWCGCFLLLHLLVGPFREQRVGRLALVAEVEVMLILQVLLVSDSGLQRESVSDAVLSILLLMLLTFALAVFVGHAILKLKAFINYTKRERALAQLEKPERLMSNDDFDRNHGSS